MKSSAVALSSIVGLLLPAIAAALPQGNSNPRNGERQCRQVRGGDRASCWEYPSTDLGTRLVSVPSFFPGVPDPTGGYVWHCYYKAPEADCLNGECYWYFARDMQCWMNGYWLDPSCNPNDHTRAYLQPCPDPGPQPPPMIVVPPSSTPPVSEPPASTPPASTSYPSAPPSSKPPVSEPPASETPKPTYPSSESPAPTSTSKAYSTPAPYPTNEPPAPPSYSKAPTAPPPYPTSSGKPCPTGTGNVGYPTTSKPDSKPTYAPTPPSPPFEGGASRATGSIACLVLSGLGVLAIWM